MSPPTHRGCAHQLKPRPRILRDHGGWAGRQFLGPGFCYAGKCWTVIAKAVTARRPKARYKVGPQARFAPLARHMLGDRGWDAFMRRLVPFPVPR